VEGRQNWLPHYLAAYLDTIDYAFVTRIIRRVDACNVILYNLWIEWLENVSLIEGSNAFNTRRYQSFYLTIIVLLEELQRNSAYRSIIN
jgi:hypothetical protein